VGKVSAQFTNGVTGLLHMPNAEMQKDGTFVVGGNFLNKHNLPSDYWWGYDSYNYFVNITFLSRLEFSYVMTLVQGQDNHYHWPEFTYGKFVNQDRHFAARLQMVKEGEWWKYMPSIVLGVNDPTTGAGGDYWEMDVDGSRNGFFNRWYIAMTRHFQTAYGELGVHAAYLYNKRTDYPLNGPAFGVNFRPGFHKNLNLIAEYDAKTINVGATYSLWADHFNFLVELQEGKYVSAGLVYKVNLIGGNRWKAKLFDY
jgi:hypothetical protein